MADLPTIKKGSAGRIRFRAADEDGPLPLPTAQTITLVMKGKSALVEGVGAAIEPPDEDGFNGQCDLTSADTTQLGVGIVETELAIDWGSGNVTIVPGERGPLFKVTPRLGS